MIEHCTNVGVTNVGGVTSNGEAFIVFVIDVFLETSVCFQLIGNHRK
jgi:hypothetical protein